MISKRDKITRILEQRKRELETMAPDQLQRAYLKAQKVDLELEGKKVVGGGYGGKIGGGLGGGPASF